MVTPGGTVSKGENCVKAVDPRAGVELLWRSWWGKNVLADGFHVKIGRFNVDKP